VENEMTPLPNLVTIIYLIAGKLDLACQPT
jgi:hypothetical protein